MAMVSMMALVVASLCTSSPVKHWYSRKTTRTPIATLSSMTAVKNVRSAMPTVTVKIVKIAQHSAMAEMGNLCQEPDFVNVMMCGRWKHIAIRAVEIVL